MLGKHMNAMCRSLSTAERGVLSLVVVRSEVTSKKNAGEEKPAVGGESVTDSLSTSDSVVS
jgi:hypothetical protein